MPPTIGQYKKDTRTKRQKQKEFLIYLADMANVSRSAKKAKIGRQTVYDWLDTDERFRTEFDKAVEIGTGVLEDEAARRAIEGTLKPVFQQGKKVGAVREYSDTLLIVLLKARAPEKYKDRVANEHTGKNGGPIQTQSKIPDLSSLSDDELALLEKIVIKNG